MDHVVTPLDQPPDGSARMGRAAVARSLPPLSASEFAVGSGAGVEMASALTERIRPDAAVWCSDGQLGRVARLDRDPAGGPGLLIVRREAPGDELRVPLDLVRGVETDGTVRLGCRRAELEDRGLEAGTLPNDRSGSQQTLELREEELVPRKELREVGQAELRKEVEEVPRRLEVEAYREEAIVEHIPVNQVVSERRAPWEEDGALVVPVYEEQLVVVKRLVLREQVRVRRQGATERQIFEDTVRRERLVVDDPAGTGLVHERHLPDETSDESRDRDETRHEGGVLEKLGRRLLE
jgi:uncharacterized protein (TIGR02271 family)